MGYSPWGHKESDTLGFPGDSDGKESAYNVGDLGLIPGLGISPEGGHGNPLQYSYWRIPLDRGAWQAIVHGVTKSQTQLRDFTCFSAGYIFPTVTQYPLLLSPSFLYIFVSLIPHGGLPTQKQPIKYFPNQTWFQHMSVSGAYC